MIHFIESNNLKNLLNDELISLITFLLLYLTYYFASDFRFVKNFKSRFHESKDDFEASVYFRRTLGFVLLGLIPFLIALFVFKKPILSYGLALPSGKFAWLWFLAPTLVMLFVSIIRPSKKIDLTYYPEVRKTVWTRKRTIINALFWSLYLLGYEFGLRGFLFFSSIYAYGLWPALIINSVIYSLIHIFKGPGEAFGAFFLGILFCLITYYTNSFWIAFIIHAAMAIINDIKAVKAARKKGALIETSEVKS